MTETAPSPRLHRSSSSRPGPPLKTSSTLSQTQPPTQPLQTSSPNYFGFQVADAHGAVISDLPQHHSKSNWSPPSSTVRSTAAASPSVVPVDQNPDFDAFRRQSEGKSFNLGGLSGNFKLNMPMAKKGHGRSASKTSPIQDGPQAVSSSPVRDVPQTRPRHSSAVSLDPASAELSRSPKRMLSPGSIAAVGPNVVRRMSPASFLSDDAEQTQKDGQPRLKLPLDKPIGSFGSMSVPRSETLPELTTNTETEAPLMVTPQRVINLLQSKSEEILLLDLRVSTQYAASHIIGALNLCIPTTLLKRPSFNVAKLADTFKDEGQRQKFQKWRNSHYIIVYDAASSQLKDAQICVNTIKKFESEGFSRDIFFIKGGFAGFGRAFPDFTTTAADESHTSEAGGPEIAPVIGGCPMPVGDTPANPFFGNIRQNMDLIGGVGQIPLQRPVKSNKSDEDGFPEWLQKAADERDQGKKVSNKFEQIERREKKRMEDALSGKVSWVANSPKEKEQENRDGKNIQVAGIEKGSKNRYNNIWPFEHSRVKLQGVAKHDCDYFNANYIQASWSHKRYISTQAPIPTTFNDFWNVIWQQDIRVIVMLTAEKEGAQVKAHNYWDQKSYGSLHLDFLSEKRASLELARIRKHQKRPSVLKRHSTSSTQPQVPLAPITAQEEKSEREGEQPYVVVRKFMLAHERKPFEPMREITQLQYSSWPDFGAPAHPAHLLGLVEQTDAVVRASNKHSGSTPTSRKSTMTIEGERTGLGVEGRHPGEPASPQTRPVMVHCSAGCGRTGTFCTVDSVIDMLKRQRLARHDHKRQCTPMDVDSRSPRPRPHPKPAEDPKAGFFGSTSPATSEEDDDVDGSWLFGDDVDLIEKTVETFRHQRLSMVQSLRQYVLCYETVMEWLVGQAREPGSA